MNGRKLSVGRPWLFFKLSPFVIIHYWGSDVCLNGCMLCMSISIGIHVDATLDMEHLSVFLFRNFSCETEDGIGQSDPAWDPWDTLGHL